MNAILTLAWLTFQEARRRSVVLAALVLGAAFLLLFGAGLNIVAHNQAQHSIFEGATGVLVFNLLALAGLYVVHFLAIMLAIVATVDAVSGEIASHTVQTLVTRPLARWQLITGKWLGYVVMLVLYTTLLCLGVLLETA